MTEKEVEKLISNEEELRLKFKHSSKKSLIKILMDVRMYFPEKFATVFHLAYKVLLILLFATPLFSQIKVTEEGDTLYCFTGNELDAIYEMTIDLEFTQAINDSLTAFGFTQKAIIDAQKSKIYDLSRIIDLKEQQIIKLEGIPRERGITWLEALGIALSSVLVGIVIDQTLIK